MNAIKSLFKDHPYYSGGAVLLIVILFAVAIWQGDDSEGPSAEAAVKQVETLNVSQFGEGAFGVAYPTASSNSFVVRAEAGGRVNNVVKSGTTVEAGSVIAELDNASERAALTQAQGTYEAALAGAAQSDVGVTDARTAFNTAKADAVSANRSALTAWNNVLFNTVDELFTNPRIDTPGVRIEASGQAVALGNERSELNAVLSNWQKSAAALNANADTVEITRKLDEAIRDISRLSSMVDTFIALLPRQSEDEVLTASEITRLSGEFAAARATLNGQSAALESTKGALLRAEEAVSSASIGGTGGRISSSNAAIKQALGAYQAAQANYDKTVVKAPFAGTVTSLNVTVGDIINIGTDISIIVPAEGVETKRWWNLPLSAVKYAPDSAYVLTIGADGTLQAVKIETGLVTTNSIKISGLQGNETVVKDVRGLKAGEQVAVTNQ